MDKPDMVWADLPSGREGSVQECLLDGMNISTLLQAPAPPDITRPRVAFGVYIYI
jgi:hypothetical protein